jgi:predicted O-methyltransferase YrrM
MDSPAIAYVLEAYRKLGYEVLLGNPDCLVTQLSKDGKPIKVSAAISLSDILVFQWIAQFNPWRHALVIGNAFGFSTFVIAALSPGCSVDAIDAEVEGSENGLGSLLTREIASLHFPGVQLTRGYSPRDLDKACHSHVYDFIFIDGGHTNDQLVADFEGIIDRRSQLSVVYCHDVGMAKMDKGWARIKAHLLRNGDKPFDLHFTSFGSTLVVSNHPELETFLETVCHPLQEPFFYFGAKHTGFRSALSMLLRTFQNSSCLSRISH